MKEFSIEQLLARGRIWLDGYFKVKTQSTVVSTLTPAKDHVHIYAAHKAGVSNLYFRDDAAVEHDLSLSVAPVDADFLVGTANATLTNEIVVGTTPGGELGGTWASPTVDTTHSGSAHHSAVTLGVGSDVILTLSGQELTLGDVATQAELNTHAAAADPHTGYRLESADHTHATTGLQAGTLDHGAALTGLSDDDHALYLLASDATNRTSFATNWLDLTDTGATTLHSHAADTHALLSTTHTDTAASAVTRGDLVYGNSTPAWDDLAVGSNTYVLGADGTDVAWVPSVSPLLLMGG